MPALREGINRSSYLVVSTYTQDHLLWGYLHPHKIYFLERTFETCQSETRRDELADDSGTQRIIECGNQTVNSFGLEEKSLDLSLGKHMDILLMS